MKGSEMIEVALMLPIFCIKYFCLCSQGLTIRRVQQL